MAAVTWRMRRMIGYALVTLLIVGIARSWELVGDRDTGFVASIAVLSGHPSGSSGQDGIAAPEAGRSTETGDGPGHEPDAHQAGERGE